MGEGGKIKFEPPSGSGEEGGVRKVLHLCLLICKVELTKPTAQDCGEESMKLMTF